LEVEIVGYDAGFKLTISYGELFCDLPEFWGETRQK
jgi:hypothetical protein